MGDFVAISASASDAGRFWPRRVLFVGDSLTYYHDLYLQVKVVVEAATGQTVDVEQEVHGGHPLSDLWDKKSVRRRIREGKYDAVVLQEDLPETSVEEFHKYAERFSSLVKESGAAVVLYMTWEYKRLDWITTDEILREHQEAATRHGACLAPVGEAWRRALLAGHGKRLFEKDKEHPSPFGTYLAAVTIAAAVWGVDPRGVRSSFAQNLQANEAAFLEQLAFDTVQELGQQRQAAASPPEARVELVSRLFGSLDLDHDGLLASGELRPFYDFVGFHGDAEAWAAEFVVACADCGCSDGMDLAGFARLLGGCVENALFATHITDEEIQELLETRSSPAPLAPPVPPLRKVVIVPGNGGGSVRGSNWYGWLAFQLERRGFAVGIKDMPDPYYARESRWLPFIVEALAGGVEELAHTIVVGHSSGAAAAMRLAERHRIGGVVLVAAYTSDLGDETERLSGYFSRPWNWEQQRANCGFIAQFASRDDPFLPIDEQRKVRDGLAPLVEYHEFGSRSHFFEAPFPELLSLVEQRLGAPGS